MPNCLTFRGLEGLSGLYTANLRQFGRRMSAWWGVVAALVAVLVAALVERLRVVGGGA